MDIEKLKNDIALKHGYQAGILGSAWNFAMQLTYRTKWQIALYEEVIEALTKTPDENSNRNKPLVSVAVAVEEILKPEYMNKVYTWKQVQDAINKATER